MVKGKGVILLVLLLSSVVVVLLSLQNQTSLPHKTAVEGLPVTDFTVIDPSGAPVTLESLKGKAVLLHLWASWCDTCKEEMPSFMALYKEFSSRPDLVILPVVYKDNGENVSAYLKKKKYELPVYLDKDGTLAAALGVTGVPETYIIDKKGNLFRKIIGPLDWAKAPGSGLVPELMKRN